MDDKTQATETNGTPTTPTAAATAADRWAYRERKTTTFFRLGFWTVVAAAIMIGFGYGTLLGMNLPATWGLGILATGAVSLVVGIGTILTSVRDGFEFPQNRAWKNVWISVLSLKGRKAEKKKDGDGGTRAASAMGVLAVLAVLGTLATPGVEAQPPHGGRCEEPYVEANPGIETPNWQRTAWAVVATLLVAALPALALLGLYL